MKTWQQRTIWCAVAVALTFLAFVTTSRSPAPEVASPPAACQATQVRVTAGPTAFNTTYPVTTSTGHHRVPAYEVVPVYFYNRGSTCHLLMSAPDVRALRGAPSPSGAPLNDFSVPTSADNTRRPVVEHHQKIEALFVVTAPEGLPFKGCDPATSTGFVVGGYAKPIATTSFVKRALRDVCFDSGPGANVVNFGVVWSTTG
jgi:hypothetical protein